MHFTTSGQEMKQALFLQPQSSHGDIQSDKYIIDKDMSEMVWQLEQSLIYLLSALVVS